MTIKIKKKTHTKFNVPNFGTKSRSRVPERWRKQRGIDSKKRIKRNFMGAEPTIGYGNPESIKGIRVNGNRIVIVHNAKDLSGMIAAKSLAGFDVTIAAGVSIRKRAEIVKLADTNMVKVTNPGR